MTAQQRRSMKMRPFELTMLIFAIIAFMYFTGEVLKPLALSVLLSLALSPAVRLFERLRLPRAAAAVLAVVITLGLLGGVGYVVGQQLSTLAEHLPDYQDNIERKLKGIFKPEQQSATDRLSTMVDEVTAKMEKHPEEKDGQLVPIQKVEVVAQPRFQDQLHSVMGPYLEFLGVASFVLVLVLFMLIGRESLRDRIVGLFGHRQIGLTTRTMEEILQRTSRYLATNAVVNSGFGLVIGSGLWLIGVPYAVLWGCLAALLRFIPYVGSAVSFALPLIFSIAHFKGWGEPLELTALFLGVEIILNSFLEPVIYGKTTGVSALGLLVAAMFWTWLWGTMGLLLSTPLTVCLAVLGKYVPSLRFFAILLGEESELSADVRFYQRLVALDREGALEVVNEATKSLPRVQLFDQILVPTLSLAQRDAIREELDEAEQAFIWQVIGDVLDGLSGVPDINLASVALSANGASIGGNSSPAPRRVIVGLPAQGAADTLVLRMLGEVLSPAGIDLEIIADSETPLQAAERVAEFSPTLIVVSHVPPEGLRTARYLVQRLRAQFADLPIVVGRWGETGAAASAAERLIAIGASRVVFTVADARDRIVGLALPEKAHEASALPLPA
ncbi:MAG: putative permease [Planctomycetota bacterium]|nr:putative permease [Planctomycetota bacterium]